MGDSPGKRLNEREAARGTGGRNAVGQSTPEPVLFQGIFAELVRVQPST